MTQHTGSSDAALIAGVRNGDTSAYELLYRRYADSAASVARIVASDDDEAQDLVSEAFARILQLLQAGGGPDENLGPYLRTVIRRLAIDRHRSAQRSGPADPATFDVLPGVDDPIARATDKQLVRRAFETLPSRWQEVLWLTEVEGQSPASLAAKLDSTPNGVSALAYRAREGLRQAYLSTNLVAEVPEGCQPFTRKLPALVRGTLPAREARPLLDHLGTCGSCRERRDEMFVLVTDLPALLVPALLLPAAAGTGIAAAGAGAAGGGLLSWLSPSNWGQTTSRVVATTGTTAAMAALAIAAVITLGGGPDEPSSAAPIGEPDGVAEPAPTSDPSLSQPPPAEEPPDDDAPPPAEPVNSDPQPPSADPEPTDEPVPPPESDSAPSIDAHPQDATVRAGTNVTLTIGVSGSPEPQLQWQVRAPSAEQSSTWTDIPGETGQKLTLADPSPSADGRAYRAIATNASGSATSNAAGLTVHFAPIIVEHPAGADAEYGGTVDLRAAADANPAIDSVRWQVQNGDGWQDVTDGGTSASLALDDVSFSEDGRYRAVFDNEIGTTITDPSAVSVAASGTLRTQVREGAKPTSLATRCALPQGERIYLDDCQQATWRLSADGALKWHDGRCLDVQLDESGPRLATLSTCTGASSQAWTLDPEDGSGEQQLRNLDDVCLNVRGERRNDPALAAYPCFSRWNERFEFAR